jgi:hypothetical protein
MADTAPIDFFYSDGTMTLTNGSNIAVGQFTGWDVAALPYDFIVPGAGVNGLTMVASVIDATHIQLPRAWSGPTLTAVPYFICRWIKHTDPRVYGGRVSAYLTKLRGIPDDIPALIASINASIAAMNADAAATAADRVQTGQDRTQTGQDRVQTGQDRTAADASAALALKWATQTSAEVVAGQGYGSKKYAQDAAGSAQQAAASASSIDTSAFVNFKNLPRTQVAAANPTNLGPINTPVVEITGTGNIGGFGNYPNQMRMVIVTGTPQLVQGALLVTPAAMNIQCQPGDAFIAVSDGSNPAVWQIVSYLKKDGTSLVESYYTELGFTKARPASRVFDDFSHSIVNFPNVFLNGVDSDSAGIQAAANAQRGIFVPPGKNVRATSGVTLQSGGVLEGLGYTKTRWQRIGVWPDHTVTISGDGQVKGILFEQIHPGFVPGTSTTMTDRLISDQAHILYQNGTAGRIEDVYTYMGVYGIKLLSTTKAVIKGWLSEGSWDDLNGSVCETKAQLHVASASGQPYNTEFHLEDYYIGGGNTAPLRTITVGNVSFDVRLGAGCRDAILVEASEGGHIGKGYLCANRHGINLVPAAMVREIAVREVFIDAPSQYGINVASGTGGAVTALSVHSCKMNGQQLAQRAIWVDQVGSVPNLNGGIFSDNIIMNHLRCPVVFFGARGTQWRGNTVNAYQARGGGPNDATIAGGFLCSGVSELVESRDNMYGGGTNDWGTTNNCQYGEAWGGPANGRTGGVIARLGLGGGSAVSGVTPLY